MGKRERIIKCLKKIKGDYFNVETNLLSDGWIDSFEILQLIQSIEEEFSVVIPMEKVSVEHFDSIDSITKLV